jgi:hypothetical protein
MLLIAVEVLRFLPEIGGSEVAAGPEWEGPEMRVGSVRSSLGVIHLTGLQAGFSRAVSEPRDGGLSLPCFVMAGRGFGEAFDYLDCSSILFQDKEYYVWTLGLFWVAVPSAGLPERRISAVKFVVAMVTVL